MVILELGLTEQGILAELHDLGLEGELFIEDIIDPLLVFLEVLHVPLLLLTKLGIHNILEFPLQLTLRPQALKLVISPSCGLSLGPEFFFQGLEQRGLVVELLRGFLLKLGVGCLQ